MLKSYAELNSQSKRLVQLAGATVLMVILAAWAVSSSVERQRPELDPRPFFVGLDDALPSVTRLEITDKGGRVVVEKTDAGWVLPEKGGYPARLDRLRQSFEELRSLMALALKTANPAWHKALELDDPGEGGKARRVTAKGAEGKVLADILVGKSVAASGFNSFGQFHARRPGEDQTWLVRGELSPPAESSDWIETNFLNLTGGAVREAIVRGGEGQSYVLSRASREESEFTLEPVPDGKKAKGGYVLTATANALVNLSIDDVKPRTDLEVSGEVPTVIYRTFDGLVITARVVKTGEEDPWLVLDASVEEKPDITGEMSEAAAAQAEAVREGPGAEEHARRIDEIASRFIFKVPSYKAGQIVKPLDDLVDPLSDS